MRLLVRFALAVFLLCLLIIATYKLSDLRQHVISRNDPKKDADEVVRILLMSDDSASSWKTDVSVTVNVVIVLIVSLLSIALLITGIIVIALTVDSSVMDNESGDVDETTSYLRDDQTIWTPKFLSSTDHLLPRIDIIANLNNYSVSSINEI